MDQLGDLRVQADELQGLSLDQLYARLGSQRVATDHVTHRVSVAGFRGHAAFPVESVDVEFGAIRLPGAEDVITLGKRWFAEFNPLVYDLFCGTDEKYAVYRAEIAKAATAGAAAVGAALGAAIVGAFPFISAAIAIVFATIVVKLAYDATHALACDAWKNKARLAATA
jgi:hypothetical protein